MIPKEKDAFGHEIYAHFQGKDVVEIVERDDGFISTSGGPKTYFADFEDWHTIEQQGMQSARGRTLDIGCGAGRVPLYLQAKGLQVVGIDNSPLALEVCKQRGVKDTRALPITQISSKLGTFDTIVMFGNNFGLFANPKRARWLLRRFYALTSTDGRIIAGSNDPYQTDNPDHLAYHEYNRQRGRMAGQVRIRVRYHKIIGPWFDYLMVSQEEMKTLLAGTGWHVAKFIPSESSFYIAIIEKEQK